MCKNTCTRVDGVHSTPGRGPTKTRMDRGRPSSSGRVYHNRPRRGRRRAAGQQPQHMRERFRNVSAKQQWQAESLQGLQETVAGAHTGRQAEARRHGQGRFPQGYGAADGSNLQQV